MKEKPLFHKTLQQQTLNASQMILKYLELEGVDTIFGIPGGSLGHFINELFLQRHKFKYIICRHETGASYMADGFFRTTGQMGVVAVTSGPGATNALTGALNAQSCNSPVLTITGEIEEKHYGKACHQEGANLKLDANSLYRNVSQYSALLSNQANVQTLLQQAIRECLSIPSRAAHIELPNNIGGDIITDYVIPASPDNYRATPSGTDTDKTIRALMEMLKAKRPLILLGNGCRVALQNPKRLEQFQEFATRFGIPVMTSPSSKGIFPEGDKFSLRNYGLAKCLWPAHYMDPANYPLPSAEDDNEPQAKYDFLLVLASSLGSYATNQFDNLLLPEGNFVQVDLDQAVIGRAFPVTYGIIADIASFMDVMTATSKDLDLGPSKTERVHFIEKIKYETSPYYEVEKMDSPEVPILPQTLMKICNELIPDDSHIFVDVGNIMGWSFHYLEVNPPAQIHYALNMTPMGFGTAAVIGGKMGAPDKTCVCLTGDGAFMMHGNEISTAAQYNIGVVYVVLDDNDLNMVSQGQEYFFEPEHKDDNDWRNYYQVGEPDLETFARGLGADAYQTNSPEGVKELLPLCIQRADKRRKPQVLIVKINTFEMPPYYPIKERLPR